MKTTIELPLLPLRDVVVYPHMVIPLFVGRDKSIQALEAAMAGNKQVLLVAQRDASDDDPGRDALFIEDGRNSPYANFIAARKDNLQSPAIAKLVKTLHTPEVRKFIQDKYKGAVIPAF